MIHRLLTAERSGSDRRGRRSAHAGARVLPKTNRIAPAEQVCKMNLTRVDSKAFKKCDAGKSEARFDQAGRRFGGKGGSHF